MTSRAPLIKALLPFIMGIGIAVWAYTPQPALAWAIWLGSIIFLGIAVFVQGKLPYRWRWLSGAAMSIAALVTGLLLVSLHRPDLNGDFFAKNAQEGDVLELRIIEVPAERAKTYKAETDVQAIWRDGKRMPSSGRLVIYLQKDERSKTLQYGNILLTENRIAPLPQPRNPEEFDYAAYMALHTIYHSAYLKSGQWMSTGKIEKHPFFSRLYPLRQELLSLFDQNITEKRERGVAKALVLGDDSELLPQTESAYSGTGTIHALAVSGLHVGIVFWIISLILNRLPRRKASRIFQLVVMLFMLWGYAYLTGFSPAVSRSAAMFSFVLVGQQLGRRTHIYNSICVSALVLLAFDPFLIGMAGFQLSYLAVIGIVWLQPKMEGWWSPKKKFFKYKIFGYTWTLVTVSLAAQLATAPLCLYYFNQFPTYFLFANLAILPVITIVMWLGCAFILIGIAGLDTLTDLLGTCIQYLLLGINETVEFFNRLPVAQIEGLFITRTETLLLYFIILSLGTAFILRNKGWLKWGTYSLVLFMGLYTFRLWETSSSKQLIVHSIPHSTLISMKTGHTLLLLGDTAILNDKDNLKFHLHRYAFSQFVPPENIIPVPLHRDTLLEEYGLKWQSPVGSFSGHQFAIITQKEQYTALPEKGLSQIIIANNLKPYLSENPPRQFARYIISSDNSPWQSRKWHENLRKAGAACTNLNEDFSFVQKLAP